ncbi:CapA family protein [Raineyella sp.]|nr:CapA family protein [Raineyella sp.]MEA5155406.1 CapA family protein [Raineyella sp.]
MRRRRTAAAVATLLVGSLVTGCSAVRPGAGPGPGAAITAGATPAPSPAPPRSVTVVLAGDLLWHNTTWFSAQEDARAEGRTGADQYDFGPMFGSMTPVITAADLAVCHEEVPVGPAGGPYRNYPVFAAPPQVAAGAATAGYDLCTLGSNHSLDAGTAGIARTVSAFRDAGISTTGAYATEADARTPVIRTTASGVRVAVIEGAYGLNGLQLPADHRWAVDLIDTDAMIAKAKAARAAGADIVLAALHDGTEYTTAPTSTQIRNARALADSGVIDLVYGHHVHTVQPWEKVDGTWVVYGLGNQIAQQMPSQPTTFEGITARFTFTETASGRFEATDPTAIPTYVTRYAAGRPIRLVHVTAALAGDAPVPAGVDRATLERALTRTMSTVRARGAEGITVG